MLNADYTLAFTVNAPGAYRLNVSTRRKGDMHLVEDNIFVADHFADVTALAGSAAGGILTSGTLNLADPGRANDIPLVFDPISVPFNQTSAATIFGVSNGGGVAHALSFTWSPFCGACSRARAAATCNRPRRSAALQEDARSSDDPLSRPS